MQCTPNVSRASSYFSQALSFVTAKKQTMPATPQVTNAPTGPT